MWQQALSPFVVFALLLDPPPPDTPGKPRWHRAVGSTPRSGPLATLQRCGWQVALALLSSLLLLWSAPLDAAELLQVRGPTQLQVGDRNRFYPVDLACIQVPQATHAQATNWLKQQLPRGTKLNLRPIQVQGDALIARVMRLDNGQDLSEALIQAGLAQAGPCG
ncbi:MAG: nuclease [Cyanobium sp.]